jgi:hypothetical protein
LQQKKEFGKWLMDIAKYMVTALLLSTIFADMAEPIILWIVVIFSAEVTGGQARCEVSKDTGSPVFSKEKILLQR